MSWLSAPKFECFFSQFHRSGSANICCLAAVNLMETVVCVPEFTLTPSPQAGPGSPPLLDSNNHSQVGPLPLGFLWEFLIGLGGGEPPSPKVNPHKQPELVLVPLLDTFLMKWDSAYGTAFASCDALITPKS